MAIQAHGPQIEDPGVFEVAGRVFSITAVIGAADYRGELAPAMEGLLLALACARQASERDLEAPTEALQSLSESFRYERDLITAEETERWLHQRGLTLVDFDQYFVRGLWRSELGDTITPDDARRAPAPGEIGRLLRVELLMSGEFDHMATRLSRRAAVLAGSAEAPRAAALAEERTRFLERAGLSEDGVSEWLAIRGCDRAWLDEVIEMEAAYREACVTAVKPQARERALHSLRLPLTQVEIEHVELQSRDAAREAYLCVGKDGVPMADLARESRYPYEKSTIMLEGLEDRLLQEFLCAVPGEVLQPLEEEGRFRLCRLVQKIEPSLSDESVLERVDAFILDSYFTDLIAKQVQWLIRDEAAE